MRLWISLISLMLAIPIVNAVITLDPLDSDVISLGPPDQPSLPPVQSIDEGIGGGGSGHTGKPLSCNATAGLFPINGSCKTCPGPIVSRDGVYQCILCDIGTHYDPVIDSCAGDAVAAVSKNNINKNLVIGFGIVVLALTGIISVFRNREKKRVDKKVRKVLRGQT